MSFQSRDNSKIDWGLTEFISGRTVDKSGLVGHLFCPDVEAKKLYGHYWAALAQHLRILENYGKRIPGTPSQRVSNNYVQKPYEIEMYSAHDILSPMDLGKADDSLDLENDTVADLQDNEAVNKEKHIIDTVINLTDFNTAGMYRALTNQERWDTATGMPLPDIAAGNMAIIEKIGLPANLALTSQRVYNALANNGDTLERLKSRQGLTVLDEESFRKLMNNKENPFINKFAVASATFNDSVETDGEDETDESADFIFPDIFLLCRVDFSYTPNRKRSKNFSANFVPKKGNMEAGAVIESWWEQKDGVTYYEYNEYRDPRVVNQFAAFAIDTPITV